MKLITAIMQPFMLDKLTAALLKAPVSGYTVLEARGFAHAEDAQLVRRIQVEIAVSDEHYESVLKLLQKTLHTAHGGDGLLFVTEILAAIKIRDGRSGDDALASDRMHR